MPVAPFRAVVFHGSPGQFGAGRDVCDVRRKRRFAPRRCGQLLSGLGQRGVGLLETCLDGREVDRALSVDPLDSLCLRPAGGGFLLGALGQQLAAPGLSRKIVLSSRGVISRCMVAVVTVFAPVFVRFRRAPVRRFCSG